MRARITWVLGLVAIACSGSNVTGYSGGGTPPGTGGSVSIVDFSFAPETLTIAAGTLVTWMNDGTTSHTTTADDNSWNSGTLAAATGGGAYGGGTAGQTFSHTFTTPGTFAYHCGFHASMHGVVKVN